MSKGSHHIEAIGLLKELIAIPSFSKEEGKTADTIEGFLRSKGIPVRRLQNNIWATNRHFDTGKPTILLNSHHDTVRPNKAYTMDPFTPFEKDGKLYGLGSNDAGGCLVSLIETFRFYYDRSDLACNLLLAATAEEEISGHNGIELLLPSLGSIEFGIVGEPTKMLGRRYRGSFRDFAQTDRHARNGPRAVDQYGLAHSHGEFVRRILNGNPAGKGSCR
jgi:acetylornithine deacetylase